MKRIVIHWTGSTYQPNSVDYEHYHYLITGDGLTINGKYKPEDNENCYDGKYAQHTGGGNTGDSGDTGGSGTGGSGTGGSGTGGGSLPGSGTSNENPDIS